MFNILDLSIEDYMVQALPDLKLEHFTHLVSLSDEDLSSLKCPNEKGEKTNIPVWKINNVRCLSQYNQYMRII